jgi:hypothetical protein
MEAFRVAALAANMGLIGYELVHRVPRIIHHKENKSGDLSIAAAVSGVVAHA